MPSGVGAFAMEGQPCVLPPMTIVSPSFESYVTGMVYRRSHRVVRGSGSIPTLPVQESSSSSNGAGTEPNVMSMMFRLMQQALGMSSSHQHQPQLTDGRNPFSTFRPRRGPRISPVGSDDEDEADEPTDVLVASGPLNQHGVHEHEDSEHDDLGPGPSAPQTPPPPTKKLPVDAVDALVSFEASMVASKAPATARRKAETKVKSVAKATAKAEAKAEASAKSEAKSKAIASAAVAVAMAEAAATAAAAPAIDSVMRKPSSAVPQMKRPAAPRGEQEDEAPQLKKPAVEVSLKKIVDEVVTNECASPSKTEHNFRSK